MGLRTHIPRLNQLICLCALLGLLTACQTNTKLPADPAHALARRVANNAGLQQWHRVYALRWTFNAQIDQKSVQRSWFWRPAENRVTLVGGISGDGPNLTYDRDQLTDQSPDAWHQADKWFINDSYWLLFPFHLVWDTDATLTVSDQPLTPPIGQDPAHQLTVTYPPDAGYTPGDVYKLYIDPETNRITAWSYHRGGAAQPTRLSTWERYQTIAPLEIAMDHRAPDGDFRVFFTRVSLFVN